MASMPAPSTSQVVAALTVCCQNHSGNRIAAEQFLITAESESKTFFSILQHVYTSAEYEESIRLLAAIYFKNGVEKRWRKSSKNVISAEQKFYIRERLLDGAVNVPASVAKQVIIATARIARLDYPFDWPGLIDEISSRMSQAQNEPKLLLQHMSMLHQVIKALASLRIASARLNFHKLAPQVLNFVVVAFETFSDNWLSHVDPEQVEVFGALSDLALKMSRRLVCHGYESPHDASQCRYFFSLLSRTIVRYWESFITRPNPGDDIGKLLSKHLLHAGKFYLELSANSMENYAMNYSFVLMPDSVQLVETYWTIITGASASEDSDIQKVIIQGLILLKQCIKLVSLPQGQYKLLSKKESQEVALCLELLYQGLFSTGSVTKILVDLISLYFILGEEDLTGWQTNHEQLMLSQEETHWQYNLRPCAERVFSDLFTQFKSTLTQPLLQSVSSMSKAQSGRDLLLKEALYNALGLVASLLYEDFSFDALLPTLASELRDPNTESIVKRRILILIPQWVRVKCGEEQRALVYELLSEQLRDTRNEGLSLTATFALLQVIDDWDWKVETFAPWVADYVPCLVRNLASSEELESKMRSMNAIGIIFERLQSQASSQLEIVLQQIPQEWNNCGEQHLLKVALLTLLSRIVLSQKDFSEHCHSIALPLIQYSVDQKNFEYVYLIEEAAELWHSILQNASLGNESLTHLFATLLDSRLLQTSSEILRKLLLIVESSVLLMAEHFQAEGLTQRLIHEMIEMLPQLRQDALSNFTKVLDLVCQASGQECFAETHLQNLTELSLADNASSVIDVSYICLVCRLVLANPARMARCWAIHHQGDMMRPFLLRLSDKFDNIGHAKYRKICALAFVVLSQTQHEAFTDPEVLAGLGNICDSVLAEVQAAGNDRVYWNDDSILLEDIEPDSREIERRKALTHTRDAACIVPLKAFIRDNLTSVDRSQLGVNLESLLA